ncbi:MAG: type II toxin-antitoxin system VapC family toxin [Ignavibacteria bacterium]|nr:type II toxin-antitoxin system VapC family toxin [Ignavibacteria bacterium]
MHYLIDSNILIYACSDEYIFVSEFIYENLPLISIISKIEVLGYHNLKQRDKIILSNIIDILQIEKLSEDIVDKAIELRQKHRLKLGDAIIAATALVNNDVLVTRNIRDFRKIQDLKILDLFTDRKD